jgi:hypothetical protein
VRLALFNTTMVLPQESEMAYVTYMFTMYTSALPYLRRQTSFYSDVLHMTILQVWLHCCCVTLGVHVEQGVVAAMLGSLLCLQVLLKRMQLPAAATCLLQPVSPVQLQTLTSARLH